jgi:hypothetical protein
MHLEPGVLMKRCLLAVLLVVSLSNASSSRVRPVIKPLDPVVVAVDFKDIGMVNLNFEVSIISERDGDKKVYHSDELQDLLTELELEIQGKIVDMVLAKSSVSKEDISILKKDIDSEIAKSILEKKKAYFGGKEVKVGCTVTGIYLTNLSVQAQEERIRNRW